jgi:hypothetical protein
MLSSTFFQQEVKHHVPPMVVFDIQLRGGKANIQTSSNEQSELFSLIRLFRSQNNLLRKSHLPLEATGGGNEDDENGMVVLLGSRL